MKEKTGGWTSSEVHGHSSINDIHLVSSISKLKARWCARGYTQIEGVDCCFDTFAPVVSKTTVRMLLEMAAQLGLATSKVDFTASFVQAYIDKPPNYNSMMPEQQQRSGIYYMDMPRGFAKPNLVCKMNKGIYGLCQRGHNYYLLLPKSNLEDMNFKCMTEVDPCLFIMPDVICLTSTYVDNCTMTNQNKYLSST